MAIFTVKMRASQQGRHTSGAEKTVDESRLTKTVSALIRRAKEHELGANRFFAGIAGNRPERQFD